DPKINQLKSMISEIEALIEAYIKDVDQFGTEEVKDVLKLAWDIKQIDLYSLSPVDIRQIFEVAEMLKVKKESIAIQKHKLEQYKNQITKASLMKLNEQVNDIVSNIDKIINHLEKIIGELAERSEKVIQSQSQIQNQQDKGVEFIFYKQFTKLRTDLKTHFEIFQKIERLSPKKFQKVKESYVYLEKMRVLRNTKEIGKAADEMAKILDVNRNILLDYTRNSKMKQEFSRIFQF
ncbi:MAG TPA: hypothetical protein VMV49_07045, partial [Candidatus Deferrimicrobium sp.]|nr:hypothetical protein [Candidatus Deferrimicrobium sp.]